MLFGSHTLFTCRSFLGRGELGARFSCTHSLPPGPRSLRHPVALPSYHLSAARPQVPRQASEPSTIARCEGRRVHVVFDLLESHTELAWCFRQPAAHELRHRLRLAAARRHGGSGGCDAPCWAALGRGWPCTSLHQENGRSRMSVCAAAAT